MWCKGAVSVGTHVCSTSCCGCTYLVRPALTKQKYPAQEAPVTWTGSSAMHCSCLLTLTTRCLHALLPSEPGYHASRPPTAAVGVNHNKLATGSDVLVQSSWHKAGSVAVGALIMLPWLQYRIRQTALDLSSRYNIHEGFTSDTQ